jgi:Fuc2NAc and GlcNAc transferase
MTYIIAIICFLATFLFTWIIRKVAIKKSILDIPNARSSHDVATPRGGGLAIVIVWYSALSFLYFTDTIKGSFYYANMIGLLIVIIGLLDDIFTIPSSIRFFVQFIAAALGLWILGGVQFIDLGIKTIEGNILINIITLLGIIWSINLFNFLDGIDGYISMEIIFVCLSAVLLFKVQILLILMASVIGFLIWNWQPAKIFMGDVGSTLLGYTIAIMAIYYQNQFISSLIFWIIITSLFWYDATYTLIRRLINREKIFHPHKKHAYQRIVIAGYSAQKTAIYSLLINIIVFFIAYLSIQFDQYKLYLLLVDLLFLTLIMAKINSISPFPLKKTY